MALGSNLPTRVRTEVGRVERRSTILMNAKDSKAELNRVNAADSKTEIKVRRDKRNVRPYLRSSTHKLRWTRELHQSFMRAVNRLGGKDTATPKTILELMNNDGVPSEVTIAHVKSHLQMSRTGQINSQGMPVHDDDLVQFEPISQAFSGGQLERITQKEEHEGSIPLQLLMEGRLFGTDDVVNVIDFLDEGKRKAEKDIELDLSMNTASPKFQFPSPSTPEEARFLTLGQSCGTLGLSCGTLGLSCGTLGLSCGI